ncbi:MAG: helix-turn-helix domain-containing protein [Acidobacteriaceae bacterium]
MSTDLADPADMIERGAPHVIHSDAQLEEYTEALFSLTLIEKPTDAQMEAIDLLTLLIQNYEGEHYSIPKASPIEVVRFLLDQQSLSQKDVAPEFGSESAVSMFLSGSRPLNLRQIINLSERFHVPTNVFMHAA